MFVMHQLSITQHAITFSLKQGITKFGEAKKTSRNKGDETTP